MLLTATLCLLAFGAVMVYSASSASDILGSGKGDGTGYLVRYVGFGLVGLIGMQVLAKRGLDIVHKLAPALLGVAFVLLLAVLVPGLGIQVNGARRWLGAAALQFQPSEIMKVALVLYAARYLATHPKRILTFRGMLSPVLLVTGAAAVLVAAEPDLGTALVISLTVVSVMVAAGVRLRYLAYVAIGAAVLLALFALAEPYQRARLTSFLNPWADKGGSGFQAVQGQIALGSGGLFGVGLGQSVQKVFYLPEAHTDFILAVIGEELGVAGIGGVICLYGMIAWGGLRTARRAAGTYAKLLAAGLTALILCQATLNIFVVLGLAPLTGVPLPHLRLADEPPTRKPVKREATANRDRSGRNGGARRAGARRSGRAAG